MQVGPSHLRLALSRPYPGTPGLPVVKPGHGRLRARDEMEEATWYEDGPEGQQQLAPIVKMRLTSPTTGTQDTISTRTIFTNATCLSIVLLKLNRRGDEEFCAQLDPWAPSWAIELPIGQVLIAREVRTGARLVLGRRSAHVVHAVSASSGVHEDVRSMSGSGEGEAPLTVVPVDVPQRLEWTPEAHCCFPAAFRQRVRVLLLALKHLENNPTVPGAAANSAGAAAVPGNGSISSKQTGAMSVLPPQVVVDIIGHIAHSSELILANMHHPLPAGRRGILPALLVAPPAANIPRFPVAAAADMGAGGASSTPAGVAAPGAASAAGPAGAAAGTSSAAWRFSAGCSSGPGVSGAAGLAASGHAALTAPAAFVPAEDDHVRAYNRRIEGLMEHADELEMAQEQREEGIREAQHQQHQRRLAQAQAQMMAYLQMHGLLRRQWQ